MFLAFFVTIIYFVYFRTDGGNYQSVLNIVKGLTSNTFNYLCANKNKLYIGNAIPEFDFTKNEAPSTI